jgi:ribosome-associated protein
MARIEIGWGLAIDESELAFTFSRASGPGGQNVNKVATAAEVRFDVLRSALPETVKRRIGQVAHSRLTKNGELVVASQTYRTQEQNRRAALGRLVRLLAIAAVEPNRRIGTRPTLASKKKRLEAKIERGETKRQRRKPREIVD